MRERLKMWICRIACLGMLLNLAMPALAVTITLVSSVPTIAQTAFAYDADSGPDVSDNGLAGSEVSQLPDSSFITNVKIDAAKTPLYRAVKPGELADIQKTGQLINRGSAEGKYFTSSAEDAAAYAKKAVAGFKDPPYTIIKTEVPTASLPKPVSVDGGIPAYVIPNEALPGLTPQVMPTMPIPGVR